MMLERFFLTVLMLTGALAAFAQEPLPLTDEDYEKVSAAKATKQGFSFVPLPIMGYNSDLGFQFGACADIHQYGREPSLFPDFLYHIHFEGSYYTKGQVLLHGQYDSSHLIPGVDFVASLTWQKDPLFQFYGFDGFVSPYDPEIDRRGGNAYYCFNRNMIRFLTSMQGSFGGNWGWMAGLNYRYVESGILDFQGYDSSNTLFGRYLDAGVIDASELTGHTADLIAGIKYDTRDFDPYPTKGIWAEAYLNGSPDFAASGHSFLKASLRWRHYITPGPDWLTLAYHLGYQTTLLGNTPFYMAHNISTIRIRQTCTEGLGGVNTVRGVMMNRIIGDAYAWGNFEVRMRLFTFHVLGMELGIAANPFFDVGMITKPYRLEEMASLSSMDVSSLRKLALKPHASAGAGLKFSIDKNYILSLEWGVPFDSQDGRSSLYFTSDFVF
ncbi:MAG: BamA/TamA family outer membrane protein [Bacteroidales bacterium]|nr:BamA/TamA family outer membrane protein [Bacteroidales bacterium]